MNKNEKKAIWKGIDIYMKRKDIISITGDLASGQSSVARMLSEDLNYTLYRNGAYCRELAVEKGMSITEFGEYIEKHPEVDKQIEKNAAEYAKSHNNIVIDAKMGWYAVPESFKVYLKVNIDIAAQRAFADPNRKRSENLPTLETQKEDMIKRANNDLNRYFNLYGVKRNDMSNYDLVVNTDNLTIDEVFEKVKEEYLKWKEDM